MTSRRDFFKASVALAVACVAGNSRGATLLLDASSFRDFPPMPLDVAMANIEIWDAVPELRGDDKNVVVTYPDRETRFSINGDKIELTTVFHDNQNNQDIVTHHILPFGADFSFEAMREAHEKAFLATGKFDRLSPDDVNRLSRAMTYAAIDDSYHAYAALDRSGKTYPRGKPLDGSPALAPDTLRKHFGGGKPDYATMQIPNQGVTKRDDGQKRGIATVASPDRITTVRYNGEEMTVSSGFIDRKNGKFVRVRVILYLGQSNDFAQMADNLASTLERDVPSVSALPWKEKRALAAAMVLAQLKDIKAATDAQLAIVGNSNREALELKTPVGNWPSNEEALFDTLRTRFGTLSAARPAATRQPISQRSMTS